MAHLQWTLLFNGASGEVRLSAALPARLFASMGDF